MLDDKYIREPYGIPVVSFNSIYNFKKEEYLNFFGLYDGDNIAFTHLHQHKDFEIIYISSGYAKFQINNDFFDVTEGDVIMINPYDLHYGIMTSKQDCFSYCCIDFDTNFLFDNMAYCKYIHKIAEGELRITSLITEPHRKTISEYVKNVDNAYETQYKGWEFFAKANLMLIFSYMQKNNLICKNSVSKENNFVKSVLSYIEENYADNLTSKNVAEYLSYNQSYFCREFKRNFSCNFTEYLNMFRVKKAESMIQNDNLKVSELATLVGFNNASYFTEIFKKFTGSLPSEYAKNEK